MQPARMAVALEKQFVRLGLVNFSDQVSGLSKCLLDDIYARSLALEIERKLVAP